MNSIRKMSEKNLHSQKDDSKHSPNISHKSSCKWSGWINMDCCLEKYRPHKPGIFKYFDPNGNFKVKFEYSDNQKTNKISIFLITFIRIFNKFLSNINVNQFTACLRTKNSFIIKTNYLFISVTRMRHGWSSNLSFANNLKANFI